jgi:hypothetical protein
MKIRSLQIIIGVLIVVLILQRCLGGYEKGSNASSDIISHTSDTITLKGDSIPYEVVNEIPVPYPIYIDTGSIRLILQDVDTLEILKDYFTKYVYVDTISNDSTILVILRDTITENRIAGRSVQFQSLRGATIITNSTTILKRRNKWFLGLGVSGNKNNMGLVPKLAILTKNDKLFTLGNNLLETQPNAELTLFWKISFRKKNR